MKRFHPLQPHPDAVPPEQVRFLDLLVEPWEDRQRVRVHARITPFQKPPNLEFEIRDANGEMLASAYIVENIDFDLVITMHLRRLSLQPQQFTLHANIQYDEIGLVYEDQILFSL
ncbi:hypothetical protein BECAL_01659 [Bellilinea caldifistulae]|uniref:Uncharacterized protein n=1 Tax=Bellilinea caldifistulae TaxID=360411 RepID=A0A0P6XR95_9CHLR|nr:hypothetical protein [Bellilinea caldifistulae]KPL74872.1 hypothetical protein AC812_10090 [Bellilinea caldifistulae]GAP10489.1 hypothetical protein BECAL_01659 [Bellilinea caldifistulae]